MKLREHSPLRKVRLLFKDKGMNSDKFYELTLFKNVYEDRRVAFEVKRKWGRRGSTGQAKMEEFPLKGDAEQEFFSLRDSKIEKGYRVSKSETTDSPPNINVSATPTDFASQFQMFVEEGEG